VREGNVEYIKLRNGNKVATRRWDEAKGDYNYTKWGKKYYGTLRRNYVVKVPAVVKGTRSDKSKYTYKTHYTVEKLGIRPREMPLCMKSPERRARVREIIEGELPDNGVLYEVSEGIWVLDKDGSWLISEEFVATHPDTGVAKSYVVLDRRVGARPIPPPTMLFTDAVCEVAFEEHGDNLCAPRQIAALLKRDLDEICDELRAVELRLHGTDSLDQGCTSPVILEWCRERGYGAAAVHNEQVLETLPGKPVLAWKVHADHCFFYQTPQVRRALQQRRTGAVTKLRKVQGASKTPLASEWKEWKGEIAEGHFFGP
jgi:hypothetical protein